MSSDWEIAEPRADALIESTRGFGYSPEAAIADLIDNSISAKAKNIWVSFDWAGELSTVRVEDDGSGMSEAQLANAMRLGSMSPLEERAATDLGRFGLGLKTASFSQAREVTVLSRSKAGQASAVRRWDLDTVVATGQWRLHKSVSPGASDQNLRSAAGTLVTWSKLDRLVGSVESTDKQAHKRFLEATDRVYHHLEATFHRFTAGKGRINIFVNGRRAEPWDPFLTTHAATQPLPKEELPFQGALIVVQPFVLPHRSKLAESEAARGGGAGGWNQQQGFYVYRSGRLVAAGDWLGLGLANDEHTKLARIAIDFPASLDHAWQVDVKKSRARPPGELVESLKRIARATRSKAEDVYRHRGKIVAHRTSKDFVFAWQQYRDRDGKLRYKVNRKHPVIEAVMDAAEPNRPIVERALRFIEETVPTTMIGVAIAESLDEQTAPFGQSKREIRPLADFVFRGLIEDGASIEEALERLSASEPFSQYPEVMAALKEAQK